MGKYCLLQLKRVARFLPFALCVVLVLFGCMSLVFNAIMAAQEDPADTAQIQVGLVGTAGDRYLQWGLAALQFDSSMMSIDIAIMDESAAADALEAGEIAAYVVFPEGFVEDALRGDVRKLRFVSTAGATGLVSIVKEEVTGIVDTILVACQSGAYGVGEALNDNGHGQLWGQHVNDLALEYVDFLFDRSKVYQVQSLERHGGVSMDRYMLGGLTVLLMMLSCLPFAPLFVCSDHALHRVLRVRRISAPAQTLAEFGAFFTGLGILLGVVAAVLRRSGLLPEGCSGWELFVGALPALLMIASFLYLMYCVSGHLISGVLLSFFATLALCFIGGCMYPIYFFPVSVQQLATVLPVGIARESLTGCFMGTGPTGIGPLLGYSAAFAALAMAIRSIRIGKVRG